MRCRISFSVLFFIITSAVVVVGDEVSLYSNNNQIGFETNLNLLKAWEGVDTAYRYVSLRNYGVAKDLVLKSLEIVPGFSEGLLLLAKIESLNGGKVSNIIEYLKASITSESWVANSSFRATIEIAKLYLRLLNPQHAIQILEQAKVKYIIEDLINRSDANLILAQAYFEIGRLDEAQKLVEDSIISDPTNRELYLLLIRIIKARFGSVAEISVIRKALEVFPDDVYLKLKELLALLKNIEGESFVEYEKSDLFLEAFDLNSLIEYLTQSSLEELEKVRIGTLIIQISEEVMVKGLGQTKFFTSLVNTEVGMYNLDKVDNLMNVIYQRLQKIDRLLSENYQTTDEKFDGDNEIEQVNQENLFLEREAIKSAIVDLDQVRDTYSGLRIIDKNNDSFWEESYKYEKGELVEWKVDLNQDGVVEYEISWLSGVPFRIISHEYEYQYGEFPYIVRVEKKIAHSPKSLEVYKIVSGNLSIAPFYSRKDIVNDQLIRDKNFSLPSIEQLQLLSYEQQVFENGKLVSQTRLKNGKPITEIFYGDNSNIFERIVVYSQGLPVWGGRDLNYDNQFEIIELYEDGKLLSVIYDENGNSTPEVQEVITYPNRRLWDLDSNGIFDIEIRQGARGVEIIETINGYELGRYGELSKNIFE